MAQEQEIKDKPLQILFLDPNNRIEGREVRSKLLHPTSALYAHLQAVRNRICARYGDLVGPKRMDFHVELIHLEELYDMSDEDARKTLVARAQKLQGEEMSVFTRGPFGKAVGVLVPFLVRGSPTHVTLAYFPQGIPKDFWTESKDFWKAPDESAVKWHKKPNKELPYLFDD